MSKHTPGPWEVTIQCKSIYVDGPDGNAVTVVGADGNHRNYADARLIASAPCLLAAVKEYIITLTSTVEQWGERQEQHSEWNYLQELKALVARIEDGK